MKFPWTKAASDIADLAKQHHQIATARIAELEAEVAALKAENDMLKAAHDIVDHVRGAPNPNHHMNQGSVLSERWADEQAATMKDRAARSVLSAFPDGTGAYYGRAPGDHRLINVTFKNSTWCATVGDIAVTSTPSFAQSEAAALAWIAANPVKVDAE